MLDQTQANQVLEDRKVLKLGYAKLAQMHGTTKWTIRHIVRKDTRKHKVLPEHVRYYLWIKMWEVITGVYCLRTVTKIYKTI